MKKFRLKAFVVKILIFQLIAVAGYYALPFLMPITVNWPPIATSTLGDIQRAEEIYFSRHGAHADLPELVSQELIEDNYYRSYYLDNSYIFTVHINDELYYCVAEPATDPEWFLLSFRLDAGGVTAAFAEEEIPDYVPLGDIEGRYRAKAWHRVYDPLLIIVYIMSMAVLLWRIYFRTSSDGGRRVSGPRG